MKNSKWAENQGKLQNVIAKFGLDSLLVHSDAFKALPYIDFDADTEGNMRKHIDFIYSLAESIYLPSFNYDFPKTRVFDYDNFQSQVGAIPEYYINQNNCNRTFDPMFSLIQDVNNMAFINYRSKVSSFDVDGAFASFKNKGSGFLLYGTTVASLTFIHYLESYMEVVYRYSKTFSGYTLVGNEKRIIEFSSHFRPLGAHLDYDWKKISADLISDGVMFSLSKYCHVIDAQKLFLFWEEKVKTDALYFLDRASINWVEPKLELLGRKFLQSDFE